MQNYFAKQTKLDEWRRMNDELYISTDERRSAIGLENISPLIQHQVSTPEGGAEHESK